MFIDYLSHFEHAEELCDEFEKRVEYVYFDKGRKKASSTSNFCWSDYYRELLSPIKACVQLYRIIRPESFRDKEAFFLEEAAELEDSEKVQNLEDFKSCLKAVRLGFQIMRNDIATFCSAFEEEEKERMNEAIHNHLEGCNYSCVAMSVSAAESRLLKLMCFASPESERELEKKTLGQLIYEYVSNKDNYKNVVPEKHEPLLQLCNVYRTFSVHPKKHKIKGPIASSILNLSIEFLTDQDTKLEVVKAQLIASGEDK